MNVANMNVTEKTESLAETENAKPRLRDCLMCGRRFPSEGPHHRICPKCKSSQAWRSG